MDSSDSIDTVYKNDSNDIIVYNPVYRNSTNNMNNDNFLNQNNFSLSAASVGKFVGSGEVFNLFKNRTGMVTIPTNVWRLGHNYAKVTFTSTLGTRITNYVDWIYDPASKNGGGEDYYFSNSDIRNSTPSGQKFLSGIKYYTNYNYSFHTEINNFYKMIIEMDKIREKDVYIVIDVNKQTYVDLIILYYII